MTQEAGCFTYLLLFYQNCQHILLLSVMQIYFLYMCTDHAVLIFFSRGFRCFQEYCLIFLTRQLPRLPWDQSVLPIEIATKGRHSSPCDCGTKSDDHISLGVTKFTALFSQLPSFSYLLKKNIALVCNHLLKNIPVS